MKRAAIIGCGNIGSIWDEESSGDALLTHAAAYQRCAGTTLVAGCDPHAERLERFGRTRAVSGLYDDVDKMLANAKPDVVSLCTPATAREGILAAVLEAGVRYVFCEKPIATTVAEAQRIEQLAKRHDARIAINYTRRWDPALVELSQLLQSGELGTVQAISAYYGKGIVNNGTHMLDLIAMLLGDAAFATLGRTSVHGRVDDGRGRDPTVHATLSFAGYHAHLIGTDHNSFTLFELDVVATRGRARMPGDGPVEISAPHAGDYTGYRELSAHRTLARDIDRAMLHAVSELIGEGPLSCGVTEGQRALRVALEL